MPSSAGKADNQLAESPIVAAGRLLAERGVFGLVWFDRALMVTARFGELVEFIEIGEPLCDQAPALVGLEQEILALEHDAGAVVNLPAISMVQEQGGAHRLNLLVLWSPAEQAFLLMVSRAITKADLEVQLSAQIRARLMAEAVVKQKSQELERANGDLEQFASIISHDLKEPLRAIRYLTSDLEKSLVKASAAHTRAIAARITEQSARMSDMLSALLDYSSIGHKAEAIATVDTLSMVTAIARSIPHPPGLNIELHGVWPVMDTLAAPLDLVLRNLIGNAIAHHDRETGVVRVIAIEGHNELEITVADDGPGIDPRHHAAIFMPFRVLDPGGRHAGRGMGLSFVKRTLEAVGGRLELRSDPAQNQGATFRIMWPKSDPKRQVLPL